MKTATALLLLAAMGDLDRRLDTKVSLDLHEARLSDALEVFRGATGLNFAAIDVGDPKISIVVNDVSVRSALRLILAPREMTAVFEDGAVVIRNQRCVAPRMVLRIHDVRALQVRLRDFPGPRLELRGAGGIGVLGWFPVLDDGPAGLVTDEFLVMLIRSQTGDRTWETNPRAALSIHNGLLTVTQTPAVQREIEALLARLPQF